MSTMEDETYSVRLPRPVWSIIASMLSLDDRRKLMETSRDCCAGVLDYQADCCRKYLSSESFNFYQQPGKAAPDPSDAGLYANGLIRHKFGMDDVHGMRDIALVISLMFTAYFDSLYSASTTVTEAVRRLVLMMRVALATSSSRARGKVIGEFLRADIYALRRSKLVNPNAKTPGNRFRCMMREIRIFSIVHMILGTIDMSHVLPDEGPYASFFSMMDYRKFCDGFGGFLTTLKQIDATVLIPLFESNALWYSLRNSRALATLPVQLASEWTAARRPTLMSNASKIADWIETKSREKFEKKLQNDKTHMMTGVAFCATEFAYYTGCSFCRAPFTIKSSEELTAHFLEKVGKSRPDVYDGPQSSYNENISALSKILAIIFREKHLSQKDFIHLVRDCVLDWASLFVLMLLASLMEECPETEFLLRSQIFSRKFIPYSIGHMLDLDDASNTDRDRYEEAIADAYLYTISQRHFFRISKETTIRLFDMLEKKWSKAQRKRMIHHMTTYETQYFLTLHECPYGCCCPTENDSYNPNVLAFFKHVKVKVPTVKLTRWTFKMLENAPPIKLDADENSDIPSLSEPSLTSSMKKTSDGSQSSAKRAKGHPALY